MRVFRMTLNGIRVSGEVQRLLGLPDHHRQAQILVAGPSKAAAFGMYSASPCLGGISRSCPDFRVATGNDVDALAGAGLFDRPCVLALEPDRGTGVVVEVRFDGAHQVLGRLVRQGFMEFRFEPGDGV